MKTKKGSSLVLVIVCFAILTIFGAAVLSLTVSAYNKAIVDNTAKRNQYFAEGGIDIAYGLIGRAVDEGIEEGNKEVDKYMKTLNDIIESERSRVKNSNEKSPYLKEDGFTVNEEYIKIQQDEIFRQKYISHIEENIKNYVENGVKENKEDYNVGSKNNNKPEVIVNKDKLENEIKFKDTKINGTTKQALSLTLTSTFKEASTNLKGNIEKTICADYSILIPNYKDLYYIESKKVTLRDNPVWSKALCMDGNFVVKGPINVEGDVYVRGDESIDSNIKRGININSDNSSVSVAGNISTDGTFRVANFDSGVRFQMPDTANKEYKNISLKGEKACLYSGNLVFAEGVSGIKFNVDGAVYTNNDLALNSSKTNINVEKGFYGINDIDKAASQMDKDRASSSIFVNTNDIGKEDGSTITIKNDLILMGTAYVRTNESYQTGESISIRGNYIAYSEPLNSIDAEKRIDENSKQSKIKKKSLKEDNVYFEYFDPLQLVSKFKDDSNLLYYDKSDYFKYFNKEYSNKINLGKGIIIPENYTSVGALVANGKLYDVKGDAIEELKDSSSSVSKKREEYGTMVYAMGNTTLDTNEDCTISNLGGNPYDWGKVVKSVSTQIDFSIIKTIENPEESKGIGNVLYLSSNDDYVIVGKNATNIPKGKRINLLDGKGKGIIITGGNIYLAGDIDFTGTIIAKGNIETVDNNAKHIKYDRYLVEKIIGFNYDKYFKDVFKNFSEDNNTLENSSTGKGSDVGTDVIRDKLIKLSSWRIKNSTK